MKYEQSYIEQTKKLIDYYKDKNSPVKEYLVTCHNYIAELRNLDAIELQDQLEYERLFFQLIDLVEESIKPNGLFSLVNRSILPIFTIEFILYMVGTQKQLKKPIKWKMLVELQFNFSMAEIIWKIKNGFEKDFVTFAIENITIKELYKLKF